MQPEVPYVVPWTGETVPPVETEVTSRGVAYYNPFQDGFYRDQDNILWAICEGTRDGQPAYARELHPNRQKEAMHHLLCAGCSGPPARDEDGVLWLLPLLDDAEDTIWESVQTVIPPMCEGCASDSKQFCPRLRDGYVELRVQEAEKIGVRGTLYPRPDEEGDPDPDKLVLYDSPEEKFVIARQLVRELRGVTVIAFAAAAP
ncbi:hypothetical protein ACFQ6U_19025 [Streptomyces sp. NPDC056465]|uniref:hypothetical protein n=1 Tax=Streptomyces sp. NPDC056465 TaxID=3345829 RepID=UPI0036981FB5